MAKVEVLEVNGRKYRVNDVIKLQDELRTLQAGLSPGKNPYTVQTELTPEEAEALARQRRQESERAAPGTWKPYAEYTGSWPAVLESVGIDFSKGYVCERCGRLATGKVDGHHYCEHDLQAFVQYAKAQDCKVFDYRRFRESDLDQPIGNAWRV
jgi:hypothetical protein